MRWLEIAKTGGIRMQNFYRKAIELSGNVIEFESIEYDADSPMTLDAIKQRSAGFDLIFIAPEFKLSARELFVKMHSDIYQADEFDAIRIEDGQPWPLHFYAKTFRQFIASEIGTLDRKASALIAGSDIFPSSAALIFSQLGFKQIKLVSLSEEEVKPLIEHWNRSFFGIDWSFESTDSLTQDSGCFSIVVSCVDHEDEILETLYYFNFLQHSGVVLDLRIGGSSRTLIKEAIEIDARPYSGYHMFAQRMNCIFSEFGMKKIDVEELCLEYEKMDQPIVATNT